jgi:hypothetical protein
LRSTPFRTYRESTVYVVIEDNAKQICCFRVSKNSDAIHGRTDSNDFSGVSGIQLNPTNTSAAVWGENRGNGASVEGHSDGAGRCVWGNSSSGPGVMGTSNSGYGGDFKGGLAPLRLQPKTSPGPPLQVRTVWKNST